MYKRIVIAAGSAALIVGLALTLDAQTRGRAPARPRPRPAAPESTGDLTRVQFDVFQLTCPASKVAEIDLDAVGGEDASVSQVLAGLQAHGKARLIQRMDDTIALPGQLKLTSGTRVPVVQKVVVSKDGNTTPSVTYEEIGGILGLTGQWDISGTVPVAAINVEPEISGVDKSPVKVGDGVALPMFIQNSVNKNLVCTSGKPVLTMLNSTPATYDADADTSVYVMRLELTLLSEE